MAAGDSAVNSNTSWFQVFQNFSEDEIVPDLNLMIDELESLVGLFLEDERTRVARVSGYVVVFTHLSDSAREKWCSWYASGRYP